MAKKRSVANNQEPFCWEVKNCQPEERCACPAFKARMNCWEVEGSALNNGGRLVCETCPVILSRIARAIARAMSDMPQRAMR